MEEYPRGDWPFTCYFNGVALPRYAAYWGGWLLDLADPEFDDGDGEANRHGLLRVASRIGLVGTIESEDPGEFEVIVLRLLVAMLTRESAGRHGLAACMERAGITDPPGAVYDSLRDGLFDMIDLVGRDRLAFWANGYDTDRLRLVDAIARHRLPADHPDHLVAPHVAKARGLLDCEYQSARRSLVELIRSGGVPKPIRRRIHSITRHPRPTNG